MRDKLARAIRARSWAMLLAIALGSLPRVAAADAQQDAEKLLKEAARLYELLDYERALAQLQRIPALSPSQGVMAQTYVFQGLIYAEMDRHDEALAAFKAGLTLTPDAKLPVEVSPKVERDFDAVRRQVRTQQAKAVTPSAPKADAPTLASSGALAPPRPASRAVPPLAYESGPSIPLAPVAFAGVSVATAIAGAVFGIQYLNAKAQYDATPNQVLASNLLQATNQSAIAANVLFVSAGVTAASALATYFLFPPK